MATLILGGIGAVVGSAFGGPAGARLGFSIGAAIGGLLDAPKGVDQQTGKLDDLRTTTASYGTSIPLVWGSMGVGGSVIWASPLQEHKHTQHQGGKGGGGASTTSYTYTVSLAVLVCAARPGLSVSKIVANDLTIWQAGRAGNVITPRFYDGNEAQMPDALITASQPDGQAPAFRGVNYFVLESFDLSKFGNAVPNFQIETVQAGVTLGSILSDLSGMTGLAASDTDYSGATDPVSGLMIGSRAAVRESIKPVLARHLTDLVEVDGVLRTVKRGRAAALTVDLADLGAAEGATGGTLLTETRRQEVELPWRVDVTYFAAEAGKSFEQGSQGAIRIGALHQQAASIALPLSLTASEARAVAEQQLQQAWTERSPTEVFLPPRYLALAPADIITLPPGDGQLYFDGTGSRVRRLRIVSMGISLPGVLSLSCVDDDGALPAQVQPPGSALPPATATLLGAVNTDFVVWSGTELRDSDQGVPGFYLAATGGAGWPGALVYYSVSGADWILAGTVSGRSVIGTATSVLAPGVASASFDTASTVAVSASGILESKSQSEVLSGLNTARLGSEIFGFSNAALVSAGAYTLGTLNRALRASAGGGHLSGEPFVLLDPDALVRVTVPPALIGQAVQVKCVSQFQSLSGVTAKSVVIAVPTPTAAQAGIADLQNQVNSLAAPKSGIAISPPPYWQMKYLFNQLNRVPVAADFAAAPMTPYFASGGGGDLRFETPGLALNAYWQMKLKNTGASAVTVNWSIPRVDNYGSGAWNGASLFSLNNSSVGASGTFSIAAGATGLLELFYANANNAVYDPSNQGTFWFFMDALLKAGVQFVDAATGQPPPGTVQQTDIANWNGKEPGLGNPAVNGYLLTSTAAGVRSWTVPAGTLTVVDAAGNSATGSVIKIVGGTVSQGTGADAGKIIFTVSIDEGTVQP